MSIVENVRGLWRSEFGIPFAVAMVATVVVLTHTAWDFGTRTVPAPQATTNAENAARALALRIYGAAPARVVCIGAGRLSRGDCFVRVTSTSAPVVMLCSPRTPPHNNGCAIVSGLGGGQ